MTIEDATCDGPYGTALNLWRCDGCGKGGWQPDTWIEISTNGGSHWMHFHSWKCLRQALATKTTGRPPGGTDL